MIPEQPVAGSIYPATDLQVQFEDLLQEDILQKMNRRIASIV